MTPAETPLTTLIKEMREDLELLRDDKNKNVALETRQVLRVLDACDEMREALEYVDGHTSESKSECRACNAERVLAKHFGEGSK